MGKPLTLSIIIPAYNEENHLRACLDAIAAQTKKPLEVIVVDNNSTDKTVEIAKSYKFVTLIHEEEQGLIPSRNRGFNTAKGDLLARLDADSVIAPNWVEEALQQMSRPEVVALTGPGKTYVLSNLVPWHSAFWSRLYFWHMYSVLGFQVLWGPNMVIAKDIWQKVKAQASTDDTEVHEDQDLSILIRAASHSVTYDKNLIITTDGERLAYLPKAIEYEGRKHKTIRRHRQLGTLELAKKDSLNPISSWLLFIALLPFGFLYFVVAAIYSLEKMLGLKPIE